MLRKLISWPLENADGLDVVEFFQHNFYYLGMLCRDDLADEIRLDGQFAVLATPVDQNSQLDLFWAPKSIN